MPMKFIGLISGGKDSFYSVQKCLDMGHQLVELLYIKSKNGVTDSYMYQTVGHEIISAYQNCVDVPLIIEHSDMNTINFSLHYEPTEGDEIEDLYRILKKLLGNMQFEAISTGALASKYQKMRIENIASRLGIKSLTPLWNLPQKELLKEMIDSNISARVVKIANPALLPEYVGIYLNELYTYIENFRGFNYCGEGGEYETICEDVPFFKRKIEITKYEVICDTIIDKPSSAYYMKINKWRIIEK